MARVFNFFLPITKRTDEKPKQIWITLDLQVRKKYVQKKIMIGFDFKQFLDEAFRDIQNYQGRGKCFQPMPKAEADNIYRDIDNSGYHEKPNSIIVLLCIESLK